MSVFQITAKSLEYSDAAKAAEAILNHYEENHGAEIEKAVSDEVARQLLHGLPPSKGIPDVRFSFPVYK